MPDDTPRTRRDWLRATARRLADADIEAPQLVATLLLGHVLELTKEQVLTRDHHPLTDDQRAQLDAFVERRLAGEPLAYLVGSIEFFGHRFNVTRDVLLPRNETEHLVEFVLERASELAADSFGDDSWTLVDVGTGSGCIPIAVALSDPRVRAIGTDISDPALAVARENVWLHRLDDRITLHLGNLLEPLATHHADQRGRVDVITSNPPYIDPADRDTLRPEVLIQPHPALFAGESGAGGTLVHEQLLATAGEWLRPDGWLVMELGIGQADRVRDVAERTPAWDPDSVLVLPDLAGIDRVFACQRARD